VWVSVSVKAGALFVFELFSISIEKIYSEFELRASILRHQTPSFYLLFSYLTSSTETK
jgi:hypothetical protein